MTIYVRKKCYICYKYIKRPHWQNEKFQGLLTQEQTNGIVGVTYLLIYLSAYIS